MVCYYFIYFAVHRSLCLLLSRFNSFSMSSTPRVLFFHGLDTSVNGRKHQYLAAHFPHCYTPNLKPFYLIPLSFWKAIVAIYHFKPDIIVGSSLGGFIAMFLIQTQVWIGNTILLAPATGLLFKRRLWLPKNYKNHIIIVAGRNDTTVPLDELARLQQPSLDNIQVLVVEDDHQLNKTLIEENQLKSLINANFQCTMTTYKIHNYLDCIKLWLYCTLCLVVAFIREPFTLYNTIKKLGRTRAEISKRN